MENIILCGVVKGTTELKTFTDPAGRIHSERGLIVESEDEYPQSAFLSCVDGVGANATIGSRVECHLKMRCSQSKSGVWFNNIKAWRVIVL